jgi:hypothetical protein
MGYTQEQMKAARRTDLEMLRERPGYQRIGKSGRMVRRLSVEAYMNGMKHVGVDAPSDVKERYFQENERIYLGHNTQLTPAGLVNRHGRVAERTIYVTDKAGKVARIIQKR